MAFTFSNSDPAGQAIAAELESITAAIAALDPSVDGTRKAREVYTARKRALELELVQYALGTGRLAPASIIELCNLS